MGKKVDYKFSWQQMELVLSPAAMATIPTTTISLVERAWAALASSPVMLTVLAAAYRGLQGMPRVKTPAGTFKPVVMLARPLRCSITAYRRKNPSPAAFDFTFIRSASKKGKRQKVEVDALPTLISAAYAEGLSTRYGTETVGYHTPLYYGESGGYSVCT